MILNFFTLNGKLHLNCWYFCVCLSKTFLRNGTRPTKSTKNQGHLPNKKKNHQPTNQYWYLHVFVENSFFFFDFWTTTGTFKSDNCYFSYWTIQGKRVFYPFDEIVCKIQWNFKSSSIFGDLLISLNWIELNCAQYTLYCFFLFWKKSIYHKSYAWVWFSIDRLTSDK